MHVQIQRMYPHVSSHTLVRILYIVDVELSVNSEVAFVAVLSVLHGGLWPCCVFNTER